MDKNLRWKLLFVVVVVLIGIWFLIPTYRVYFGLTEEQFSEMTPSEQDNLRSSSVSLGLDLQGGMDLLLELDKEKLDEDVDIDETMDRALSVLRNRVDEFGVVEPNIQKSGDDRVVVQLPGLTDPVRARRIVQRVALLEFRLLKEPSEVARVLRRVDRLMGMRKAGIEAEPDSAGIDSLFAGSDSLDAALDSLLVEHPLLSRHIPISESDIAFDMDDIPLIERMLEDVKADSILPTSSLLWAKDDIAMRDGRQARQLHVLEKKVQLTGEGITRAYVRADPTTGQPEVNLNFSASAAAKFARITGANVGRRLAIVLDGRVASAPVIQNKISGGRATISGTFSDDEARDLRVVLEAGALPAPLKIIEERTVGPSLGRDSIQQGLRAGWIGALIVVIFMLFYYRASGIVAVIALALNLFFIFAALAKLGATLTLPGIAGIVLTIGMAVDANVLVFERIREELRLNKTVRASIDSGYERAFKAIIDANLTTLIAAIVLLQFGVGPIRGFAVTLAIGIVCNLFTAYFVTRVIFQLVTSRTRLEKLSI